MVRLIFAVMFAELSAVPVSCSLQGTATPSMRHSRGRTHKSFHRSPGMYCTRTVSRAAIAAQPGVHASDEFVCSIKLAMLRCSLE